MTIKGGTSQACASCKYQRRRCSKDCALAPYFPADDPKLFQNAHRLFGVRNIMNILKQVHPSQKEETMTSIIFESNMRDRDPVNGCCGYIHQLCWEIDFLKQQIQQIHQIKIKLSMMKDQSLQNQMNVTVPDEIVAKNDIVYPSYTQQQQQLLQQHHQSYNSGFLVNQAIDGNDLLFGNVSNGSIFVDNDELRIQQHYHDNFGIDVNNVDSMTQVQNYPIQHEMEISHALDEIPPPLEAFLDDRQSYIESKEACDSSAESSFKEVAEASSSYSRTDLKNAAACFSLTSQQTRAK